MCRVAVVLALLAACHPRGPSFVDTELAMVRPGVDLPSEERETKRVLAQRKLSVVDELRGTGFVALGAATFDERLTAVRVITPRGVVVAEDGARDDLFAPSSVALLSDFGPSFGEYTFVAIVRTAAALDRGCVTLYRLLPSGQAVAARLDVSLAGSRACVADLRALGRGRLGATLAFPGLATLITPALEVELEFAHAPVGRPEPLVPVARIVSDGAWLGAERARLAAEHADDQPFSSRHALGVARAALALIVGEGREAQLSAYRVTVGSVPPGSYEASVFADTQAHIERGWLDPSPEQPEEALELPDDAEVIAPEAPEAPEAPAEPDEDSSEGEVIEPAPLNEP